MAATSSSSMTRRASWYASSCRARSMSRRREPPLSLVQKPAQNRRVENDRLSQFGNKGRIALRLDLREGELGLELAPTVFMDAIDHQLLAVLIAFDRM